jgi:hypothetical protein
MILCLLTRPQHWLPNLRIFLTLPIPNAQCPKSCVDDPAVIAVLFFHQQNNKILIVVPDTEILLLILSIAHFRAGEYTLSYAKNIA